MNNQPTNKTLIIIIGFLLLANIATLSFFLWKKDSKKVNRPDRAAYINNYLKEKVGFGESQLKIFDTVYKRNRSDLRNAFEEMSEVRETMLGRLASASFTDSAIEQAATELSGRQKGVEVTMLKHIKSIRDICTPAQLPAFDSGFYKMVGRKIQHQKKEKR